MAYWFWVDTSTEANFPAGKPANCYPTLLMSAEGAPLAHRSVCTVADIDGDPFLSTIGATKSDFSDCTWVANVGIGKYAGVTGSSRWKSVGPIIKDGNHSKFTWMDEWIQLRCY